MDDGMPGFGKFGGFGGFGYDEGSVVVSIRGRFRRQWSTRRAKLLCWSNRWTRQASSPGWARGL
jgi:hypothetical protein